MVCLISKGDVMSLLLAVWSHKLTCISFVAALGGVLTCDLASEETLAEHANSAVAARITVRCSAETERERDEFMITTVTRSAA